MTMHTSESFVTMGIGIRGDCGDLRREDGDDELVVVVLFAEVASLGGVAGPACCCSSASAAFDAAAAFLGCLGLSGGSGSTVAAAAIVGDEAAPVGRRLLLLGGCGGVAMAAPASLSEPARFPGRGTGVSSVVSKISRLFFCSGCCLASLAEFESSEDDRRCLRTVAGALTGAGVGAASVSMLLSSSDDVDGRILVGSERRARAGRVARGVVAGEGTSGGKGDGAGTGEALAISTATTSCEVPSVPLPFVCRGEICTRFHETERKTSTDGHTVRLRGATGAGGGAGFLVEQTSHVRLRGGLMKVHAEHAQPGFGAAAGEGISGGEESSIG